MTGMSSHERQQENIKHSEIERRLKMMEQAMRGPQRILDAVEQLPFDKIKSACAVAGMTGTVECVKALERVAEPYFWAKAEGWW